MSDSVLQTTTKPIEELDSVIVRFAGDSGDGMQLAGTQLTNTSAPGRQRRRDLSGLPG